MANFIRETRNGTSGKCDAETEQVCLSRKVQETRQAHALDAFSGLLIGDRMGTCMLNLSEAQAHHAIQHREVPEVQDVSWPGEVAIHCIYHFLNAEHEDEIHTLFARTFQLQQGDALVCAVGAVLLGAYWADDMDILIARTSAAVEAVAVDSETRAGSIAVAVAAAWAWRLQNVFLRSHREFFDLILAYVPPSALREQIIVARRLPMYLTGWEAAAVLGNGKQKTPLDTIPFVIWCAGKCLRYYEEATWTALEAHGASDVLCALISGIVVMYTGQDHIPDAWFPPDEEASDWYEDEE